MYRGWFYTKQAKQYKQVIYIIYVYSTTVIDKKWKQNKDPLLLI